MSGAAVRWVDPLEEEPPPGDAGRWIATVARAGVPAMVANAATRWCAIESGGRWLPVTVNDGERGDSYVCHPRAAYADYGAREMALMRLPAATWLGRAALGLGRLLGAAGIDRVVHVDNWLLSTNLHGAWDGCDVAAIRAAVTARHPDHLVAVRSVDAWSSPALAAALRDDGWVMVPARQVWVTDDLARDWRPRNAYGNDRRLVARSGLSIGDGVAAGEAARVAELYRMLYVGRYSALNPVFTARFVEETQAAGLIRYRVARGAGGAIVAVAGMLARDGVATPPVVGYDTGRPQGEGLYRVASWMFGQMALERGWRLHGSAGAAHFKRLRGARGVIEYWAMGVDHLPPHRRAAVRALAAGLERFAVPAMRRNGW